MLLKSTLTPLDLLSVHSACTTELFSITAGHQAFGGGRTGTSWRLNSRPISVLRLYRLYRRGCLMSRTKRVVCLQKEAVWWEMGQGKDGYQLSFLISLSCGDVWTLMETGKDVHLGSLHRKSLLNEWSIGPFLAICIPGFLSLQNALGKETRNTPMKDQPLLQLQIKARGPWG